MGRGALESLLGPKAGDQGALFCHRLCNFGGSDLIPPGLHCWSSEMEELGYISAPKLPEPHFPNPRAAQPYPLELLSINLSSFRRINITQGNFRVNNLRNGVVWGGKWRQLYLNNNKIINKKMELCFIATGSVHIIPPHFSNCRLLGSAPGQQGRNLWVWNPGLCSATKPPGDCYVY